MTSSPSGHCKATQEEGDDGISGKAMEAAVQGRGG